MNNLIYGSHSWSNRIHLNTKLIYHLPHRIDGAIYSPFLPAQPFAISIRMRHTHISNAFAFSPRFSHKRISSVCFFFFCNALKHLLQIQNFVKSLRQRTIKSMPFIFEYISTIQPNSTVLHVVKDYII